MMRTHHEKALLREAVGTEEVVSEPAEREILAGFLKEVTSTM